MAMEKITITMSSEDIDIFERGRSECGMSKSAYTRLLIAEHEQRVPPFIKYKEIILEISKLNTYIKEMLFSEKTDDGFKLYMVEQMKEIKELLSSLVIEEK